MIHDGVLTAAGRDEKLVIVERPVREVAPIRRNVACRIGIQRVNIENGLSVPSLKRDSGKTL